MLELEIGEKLLKMKIPILKYYLALLVFFCLTNFPDIKMHKNTAMIIEKSKIIEHPSPSLLTTIGFRKTHVYKNQGRGNLRKYLLKRFKYK